MTIPMPGSPECECATCEGCAEERHEGLMREGEPCPACHVHADPSYREEKRLKVVECAAEYWRAEAHFLLDLHGYEYERDPVPADHNFVKWLETCVRFDTHRHALEES